VDAVAFTVETMTTTEATPTRTSAPTPGAFTQERTLSTLALIGGIASIVFGQTVLVPVAAMVLGVLGYQREPFGRAFAVWGIVLGAVALFGWVLFAIAGALFVLPFIPLAFL
jgi:hypothetical protein